MNPKPRPNHALYIRILGAMTPEQRLAKAFELGELGRELLQAGIRQRHPGYPAAALRTMELERVARRHNRNY